MTAQELQKEAEEYTSLVERLNNKIAQTQQTMKEAHREGDKENVELARCVIATCRRYLRELRKPGEPRR